MKAQWQQQALPPDIGIILGISFKDNTNGTAGGWTGFADGRIIFTNNAGLSWGYAALPDSSRAIVDIQHISGNIFYCAGAYNYDAEIFFKRDINIPNHINRLKLLKGIDYSGISTGALFLKSNTNGTSWQTASDISIEIDYLLAMDFADANTGYCAASKGYLNCLMIKTTNSGVSWNEHEVRDSLELNEIDFINAGTGFGAGFIVENGSLHGIIVKTSNSGLSWDEHLFPEVNNFTSIHFTNSLTGYAAGPMQNLTSTIYKTTDGGDTWAANASFNNFFIEGLKCLEGASSVIAFGSDISFSKTYVVSSQSYGSLWRIDSILYNEPVVTGLMLSPLSWYIGGGNTSKAALFYTSSGGTVSINSISETAENYSMSVYPNPFNPSGNAEINLPFRQHAELDLYDISGKKLFSIFKGMLTSGVNRLPINAYVSSGAYFIKLITENKTISRRIIVLR